jgi:ferredoxin
MRLKIDHKLCLKSGQCAYMQPEIFKMNEDGSPVALVTEPTGAQIEQAQDAVTMCPSQAISLEE